MVKKFYAVKAGYKPGIYSYEGACLQIKGFSKPQWKGFNEKKDAEEYLALKTTVKTTVKPKAQSVQKQPTQKQPTQKKAVQKQPAQKAQPVQKQPVQKSQPVQKQPVQKPTPKPQQPPPPKLTPEEQADKDLISARGSIEAAKKELAEAEAVVIKKQKAVKAAQDKTRTIMSQQAQKFSRNSAAYYVNEDTVYDGKQWKSATIRDDFETVTSRSKEAARTTVYLNKHSSDICYTNDKGQTIYQVYTDGACSNNGTMNASGGIGVFFGKDNENNTSEPLRSGQQTNQRAELAAVLRAFELVAKQDKNKLYRINTDSTYVINCLTKWCHNWKKNGWREKGGLAVQNRDLIEEVLAAQKRGGKNVVGFQKVPAHSNCEGNIQADKLAKEGTTMQLFFREKK